jgi:alpha-1,6-mannosyltransferase
MHLTNAWSETSGGIATFYHALMAAATRRRHKMCLVVPAARERIEEVSGSVRIYHVAAPTAKLNPSYRMIYPNQFLWPESKLRGILRSERPELVEINDKYGINYLGPLLRLQLLDDVDYRPVVLGLTCERMDENFKTYLVGGAVSRWFCSAYMRYVYFPFFDHHIAVSDGTAEELRAASLGHAVERGVWQLPMGVDCDRFSPRHRSATARAELLRRLNVNGKAWLLLYVGRLAPEKNLNLLLETLAHLCRGAEDYRLVVAGDGVCRASFLAEAAGRFGSRVTWLGHIANREQLASLYANCDFFIHPNPREPFGIAPLEAMASGLALIAPKSGGVTLFANKENAVLVEPTAGAFASATRELASNSEKRRQIMSAAYNTAQQYSWKSITDRFFDLYESLHRVQCGELSLGSADPLFVSSAPSARRKSALSASATVAKTAFRAAAWLASVGKPPQARVPSTVEQR